MSPYRVQLDGEPVPNANPNDFDLSILVGGANVHPNAYFVPLLQRELIQAAPQQDVSMGQRDIDVLYRSSNCTADRETRVRVVREAVEEAGFTFAATGSCVAGGTHSHHNAADGHWSSCPECQRAKTMIAFENFTPGFTYLSEKPFLPGHYGAIPLYHGNGYKELQSCGFNTDRMLVHKGDDQAFAIEVVGLLQNPERLEALAKLSVGDINLNLDDVRRTTCQDAQLKAIREQPQVCIRTPFTAESQFETFLPELLCLDRAKVTYSCEKPDIEVEGCCWPRKPG